MSRCKTGWRIYCDRTVGEWAAPWTATHPRGLTLYRSAWDSAFSSMVKDQLRDWERVDGEWRERKGVAV